jgi:hypothetical protein
MGKKIILHESQLKRLIQHQTKIKLKEDFFFKYDNEDDEFTDSDNEFTDDLNLDVEDGKFIDKTPYNSIDDSYSENETAWDGMYDSDEMEEDSISLNEGQLKLKESFKKFVTPSIINRQSSDIVRKRKR